MYPLCFQQKILVMKQKWTIHINGKYTFIAK